MEGWQRSRHVQDVTIRHLAESTTQDEYGNDIPGTPTDEVIPRCLVAPRSSTERGDSNTPAVITALSVYLPPGVSVKATDQFRIGTPPETWEVEGRPGVWGIAGVEVALKLVSGAVG